MKQKFPYRLGLDIGTNSIGWCIYRLNQEGTPVGIHRAGTRIFPDGRDSKTAASLAATRRMKRQARRRHDRVLKRQHRFLEILIESGLLPSEIDARRTLALLDPYELRLRALDHPLQPHELGRALYHLAKRRGFQSSRKDSAEDEKETGRVKDAINTTKEAISSQGCRTYGEYLALQHRERKPVRARSTPDGKGYIHYPQRAMIAEEFDTIWKSQAPRHPSICTESIREALRDALLFQRKLRPVEPGTCIFEEGEYRIPQCAPLQQQFRILQELNHLRIGEAVESRPLSLEERDRLYAELRRSEKLTFVRARKVLGLPRTVPFNLESEKRKYLKGDTVSAQLCSEGALGERWWELSDMQQESLALLIENALSNEELRDALKALPGDTEPARRIVRGTASRVEPYHRALGSIRTSFSEDEIGGMLKARMPEGYASLSRQALERIVPALREEVITYDQAVRRAGYDNHADFYDGVLWERLPYYGQLLRSYTTLAPTARNKDERRYGRLPNPTVHIGLNQLRVVVNEMLRRWGWPTEIVVELAREFGLSGVRRREIEREQGANQERNQKLNERLQALGQRENRANRQRLLLWDELGRDDANDRYCVYTGERLAVHKLFSTEIEIDHILPFSRTLDDSLANKVLCLTRANRAKRNQSPFEAFGHSPTGYDWGAILDRASRFPGKKGARFRETAIEDYIDRHGLSPNVLRIYGFGETEGFLARHLADTAYLSRIARRYLTSICPPNKVWVVSGRVTSKLRYQWELDRILDSEGHGKNRDDHRHHAVDAAVVGLCDRSLIQRMAQAARKAERMGENRLLADLPLPWPKFRDELANVVSKILVSHRADHSPDGALHNDTNYGLREAPDNGNGVPLVVHRVPLMSLTSSSLIEKVYDPILRSELRTAVGSATGAEAKARIEAFSARTGVRRARIAERLSVIPIHDRRNGRVYRYVKGDGNYCYDINRHESGRWTGTVVSIFEAHSDKDNEATKEAEEEHVMRLRKNDLILLEGNSSRRVMRVVTFSNGRISLAEHCEANVDARNRNRKSGFAYLVKSPDALRKLKARVVGVNALGYLNDPGYRE